MQILSFPNPHELALSIRATALVFEDPRSHELLRHIELVAPSQANVLIIGETGTGKELVARHVHALGPRPGGPFVAVNCGAFSESLVEAELFGYEKGAFTGAIATKPGWFETANGGTLFLDEIGDLPLPMQVKLLRVLQEREVTRIGARQPARIDVRLVAATNVRLEDAVRAGRFREDLYYRLNVARLTLLPLRDRPGDILPLARHFVHSYCARLGNPDSRLDASAQAALLSYPWPGNIRELENVIHHALLVSPGGTLTRDALRLPDPQHAVRLRPESEAALPRLTDRPGEDERTAFRTMIRSLLNSDRRDLYATLEAWILTDAFEYADHNQLRTARLLGVSRNILRSRLARLGLIGPGQRHDESLPGDSSGDPWTSDGRDHVDVPRRAAGSPGHGPRALRARGRSLG